VPRIKITTRAASSAPPERVLAAARDFSARRERVWPNVKASRLEVHAAGRVYADVTEATWIVGRWWERCRYDWSRDGVVTATVIESNVYLPEVSRFVWHVTPRDRGSEVEMTLDRTFRKGPKGLAAAALYRVGGRRLFGAMQRQVLEAIERQPAP
jgi:hypothetical protein